MEITSRLFTKIEGAIFYDYSSPDIEFDRTWSMEPLPYPPEPSFDFLVENSGVITKYVLIWEGYFDSLFYYAHKEHLLESDFGKVIFQMCWIGDTDDDWMLNKQDLEDFISMLRNLDFYEVDEEQKKQESIFLSSVSELEELRQFLLDYFQEVQKKGSTVYLYRG